MPTPVNCFADRTIVLLLSIGQFVDGASLDHNESWSHLDGLKNAFL